MPPSLWRILLEWAEKAPSELTPLLGTAAVVMILGLLYRGFDRMMWGPGPNWRTKSVGLLTYFIVASILFFVAVGLWQQHGPDVLWKNASREKDEVGFAIEEPTGCFCASVMDGGDWPGREGGDGGPL